MQKNVLIEFLFYSGYVKMFAVALFAALVAIASSAPQGGNTPVPILSSEFDQKEDGSYSFS